MAGAGEVGEERELRRAVIWRQSASRVDLSDTRWGSRPILFNLEERILVALDPPMGLARVPFTSIVHSTV